LELGCREIYLPSYNELPVDQGPKACISAIIISGTKKEKQQKLGITFMIWWMIWKERNRRIF
jgi:hypothetical protein